MSYRPAGCSYLVVGREGILGEGSCPAAALLQLFGGKIKVNRIVVKCT